MSHSTLLIRPPADQHVNPAAAAPRRAAGAANASSPFAALMAGQEESAAGQKLPATAQRPQEAVNTLQLRNPVLAGRSPSDLARAQVFSKAQSDLRRTQALDGLMQNLSGGDSPLDLARNLGTARHLRSLTRNLDARLGGLSVGDFIHTRPRKTAAPNRARATRGVQADSPGLGQLSARFESGGDGVAAVGYDRNGGTSYGKYQIASRVGSMKNFLEFLDGAAPDLSQRLRRSGPANTGSRRGGMPDTWRAIAREQPERFEALQEAFIRESHYKPALEAIVERTGLEADKLSPAMREVIWSTAVQHGPAGAARIFDRADRMSGKPTDPAYERKLISHVYALRAGQFGSSSREVQAAVSNRFKQEKMLALNMLDGGSRTALA
ncbi:hypothetical protein [Desulfovibrio sp. ZJ200]|uniref:VgrG-related protein n=1 Tax=Desulfovibrio sp. ZJ200 TaxID=2709792 RepID=UPI0013ED44AC|nr:hypothetical protein [Desulfovibrio sp. ZJ200]